MCMDSHLDAAGYFEAKLAFTAGPYDLNEMMKRGEDLTVVDVRAPEDFEKSHIPGAINVPQDKWEATELDHHKVNVFYCYSQQCHLAAKAAYFYALKGVPVKELEGGWAEWENYGMPIEGVKETAA